jgi:hypothetical protein
MSYEPTTASAFATYVNLAARELELWLGTDASAAAAGAGNTEGHEVLRVLRIPKGERTDADTGLMRRAVEHIRAEREREPEGPLEDSPWRHGLMNWGHDPMTWTPGPPHPSAVATAGREAVAPRPRDPPGS